ncbi:MAG: hypothetical protein M3137_04105, partial [Actinomycetota bacterium]|nr:hypothetical protein [Actinomycetota bacterium]
DVLSYEQMMNHYAQVIGRRRVVLKVPVLTPRLSAHWIGLVTDLTFRLPGLSTPWLNPVTGHPLPVVFRLAESLWVEVVVTDDRIRSLVPFEPMGFDEAVRLTVPGR